MWVFVYIMIMIIIGLLIRDEFRYHNKLIKKLQDVPKEDPPSSYKKGLL